MLLIVVVAFVGSIVLATAIASSIGSKRFRERYAREKAELVQRALPAPSNLATPPVRIATLQQRGSLRVAADKPWMPFEAEQVYSLEPPGFVWLARARVVPFIHILARDKLEDGRGNMLISLLGMFTIADASGPEIDQGAGLRYWGEVIAFPEARQSPHLRWEPLDGKRARLVATGEGPELAVVVDFDDEGRPSAVHAERYRDVEGKPVLTPWSGQLRDWKVLDGRLFPTAWESVWHLPEGDFIAVKMQIVSVRTE